MGQISLTQQGQVAKHAFLASQVDWQDFQHNFRCGHTHLPGSLLCYLPCQDTVSVLQFMQQSAAAPTSWTYIFLSVNALTCPRAVWFWGHAFTFLLLWGFCFALSQLPAQKCCVVLLQLGKLRCSIHQWGCSPILTLTLPVIFSKKHVEWAQRCGCLHLSVIQSVWMN